MWAISCGWNTGDQRKGRDIFEDGSSNYLLERLKNGDRNVEPLFTSRSMFFVLPVSSIFSFIGIQPAINICSVFHFESLRNLYPEVSKSLEKFVSEMLRDEPRTTNSFQL